MKIKLNGEDLSLDGELTVEELLDKLSREWDLDLSGAVVLVNDDVIKKNDWKTQKIAMDYVVEVLSFVSGG